MYIYIFLKKFPVSFKILLSNIIKKTPKEIRKQEVKKCGDLILCVTK